MDALYVQRDMLRDLIREAEASSAKAEHSIYNIHWQLTANFLRQKLIGIETQIDAIERKWAK